MKRGTTVALSVAGGYLLGRFRKARWLLMTAAAVAASRKSGGGVLQRGAETLKSSPEVGKLAEQGRQAAAAVLGRRMEGLTGRVHSVTERLQSPGMGDGRRAPAEGEQEAGAEGEQPEQEDQRAEGEQPAEGEEEPGAEGEGEQPEQGDQRAEGGQPEGEPRGGGRPGGQQAPQRAPRPGTRRPGVERAQRQDRRADPTGRRTGPSRIRR